MPINIDKSVDYAKSHAESGSKGLCARYVRLALEAGGADLKHHPVSAKNYGPTLIGLGFKEYFCWDGFVGYPLNGDPSCRIVNQCYEYTPVKGDVIVIQPYDTDHPHGHIAIYTGAEWISDFKQRDMWAGPGYRKARPTFIIYRL